MADNGGMIKLGLVAAAAYYAYTQGWLSVLGLGGMPSDAVLTGTIPVGKWLNGTGSGCPTSASPATVLTYMYYSPSKQQMYCTTTAPTAAQVAAGTPGADFTPAPAAPAPVIPDPNAITGANTVAGIQARVLLSAKAPAAGLSADQWGYFLNAELAPLGKAAPDPLPLFTAAVSGFDRSQVLTAGQYWAVVTPALKSPLGLSGLGMYWTEN